MWGSRDGRGPSQRGKDANALVRHLVPALLAADRPWFPWRPGRRLDGSALVIRTEVGPVPEVILLLLPYLEVAVRHSLPVQLVDPLLGRMKDRRADRAAPDVAADLARLRISPDVFAFLMAWSNGELSVVGHADDPAGDRWEERSGATG